MAIAYDCPHGKAFGSCCRLPELSAYNLFRLQKQSDQHRQRLDAHANRLFALEQKLLKGECFSPENPAFDADLRQKNRVLAGKIAQKIAESGAVLPDGHAARTIATWTALIEKELQG